MNEYLLRQVIHSHHFFYHGTYLQDKYKNIKPKIYIKYINCIFIY
jgi:hypothetical protein